MKFRRLSLFALLISAVLSPTLSSAVPIPESRVGKVLEEFIDSFNSGERDRLQAFFETYGPDWMPEVEKLAAMQASSGGVDIVRIGVHDSRFVEWVEQTQKDHRDFMGMMEISDGDPIRLEHLRYVSIEEGSQPDSFAVDAQSRSAVVATVAAKLNETYVFPKVAKEMSALIKRNLRQGHYDALSNGIDFSEALTKDLRSASHDKHLGVSFSPMLDKADPPSSAGDRRDAHRAEFLEDNCGFRKAEVLPDNVGYLKFDYFPDPQVCGDTAIAAMRFVAHTDALIFDLRENGGGDPAMIALISTYLFPESTHLSDIWTRTTNETQQYWTLPYVPGVRMPTVPAYVLTSPDTFSGAEEFANNLKTLKRATIVGEVTGGGAHPVESHRVDDRFTVWVPFASSVNPLTHTNWEGRGVEPDVAVKADVALDKALALAREARTNRPGVSATR